MTSGGPDDRPTLVLIHGAGGSSRFFQAQRDGLAARVQVLTPDLPGHGSSLGPALPSIQGYAQAVFDQLDRIPALPPLFIGGLSMGGAIAMQCLLEQPDRFAGGVLLATGAKLKVHPAIFEAIRADFSAYVDMVATTAAAPGTQASLLEPVLEDMRRCGPDVVTADFSACDAFDIRERVSAIGKPALILCGDADLLTPPRFGTWLSEHLPEAELVRIPGAGHFVSLEQPAQVNRAIADFIERTRAQLTAAP